MAADPQPPKADDDPDFSNVESGSSSTAPAPATPAPAEPKTYTVAAGDSLSKIAQHQYGNANLWRKIYEANQDTIKNPDLIHPGQTLIIPDLNGDTQP
jgi:nucleoid-associated protein YgaU